ncbi:hypothetical protein GMA11_06920 [Granulicatella sp. zg-ZJ]|uniref:hypothetical protein n=1 Tax=Granulicatella sp. zg-ZJ TaxID=2678504 RepID=UPI0013D5AC49|nr:hypothetical protein [Granulicatella sp. zg-ZJ]NEW63126.1 hypothetical protein [Granulicatella sp. zg-ZJ]
MKLMKKQNVYIVFILGLLVGWGCLFAYYHTNAAKVPVQQEQVKEKLVSKVEPIAFSFDKKLNLENIQQKNVIEKGDNQLQISPFKSLKIHGDEDVDSLKIGRMRLEKEDLGEDIAHYSILGDTIYLHKGATFKEDTQKEISETIVRDFLEIVPAEYREHLTDYHVYQTGASYMFIIPPRKEVQSAYSLGVGHLEEIISLDKQNSKSRYEFEMPFIVNALGHLLYTMPNQIDVEANVGQQISFSESIQKTFNKDSYLRQFFTEYWKNVDLKWIDVDETTWEAERQFFKLNKDNFVSLYARKDIYEDFAESFKYFVLTKSTDLDVTKPYTQKILFFYQYPELVELRTLILTKMVEYEKK